ncbi:MAG: signal peptidase I [Candidatus Kuenenbacteria bacterium]
MRHATSNQSYKNFNTFRFFEDNYNCQYAGKPDRLVIPQERKKNHFILKLAFFLMVIGCLGISLPPVLSYVLKTPYPLIVISENSMEPALKKNDLVLIKGVIDGKNIQENDIVIYNSNINNTQVDSLSVGRVVKKENSSFLIGSGSYFTAQKAIANSQVIGKTSTFKIPWVGVLGNIFKH